ncbi:hypothetical protein [Streptomyces sp. 891-h]|uniref:hypothetical protein n=1 Tax=Streptomyces sp. 891-h TaxID=2720714 RepID=UPI001FAA8B6C|nr:hypothetical protein [Streptomyces sp. 891-h]UNZ22298.1 hypothetical protein HC362_34590 [Streptomyces sp. 891-h]
MDMHTDDEIYSVDDTFLGPPGQTLPWAVRYRAYGIGSAIFALILGLELWLGILGPWNAVYGLLVTIGLTMWIMGRITHEYTLRALATTFWHEVSAPRPRTPTRRVRRSTLTTIHRRTRNSAR